MYLQHKPGGIFTLLVQDAHLHQGQLEPHHIISYASLFSLDCNVYDIHLMVVLLQLVILILRLQIVRINLFLNYLKDNYINNESFNLL